jgi:acetyl-CoA C-acetyltransferase
VPVERIDEYGSSLVVGHPQGPARGLSQSRSGSSGAGGGIGPFTGCAAGDTGASLVVRVED